MPGQEFLKIKPLISKATQFRRKNSTPAYAELQVTSNFSFLQGASHPEELISTAAELGYRAISITDQNSLAGVVRAHVAAKSFSIPFIVGTKLILQHGKATVSVLVYPTNRRSYGKLCRLLTLGRTRVGTTLSYLTLDDFLSHQKDLIAIIIPHSITHDYTDEFEEDLSAVCLAVKDNAPFDPYVSLGIARTYGNSSRARLEQIKVLSEQVRIPLVATNDVFYHSPHRKPLQDILTCIKDKCVISQAGFKLQQNAERFLKPPEEMNRLFRDLPQAIFRGVEIAEATSYFSLDELRYEYPEAICPPSKSPGEYLRELVEIGITEKFPTGIPLKIRDQLAEEFTLIAELQYEKYFLTCYDIVKFARSKDILCQGRGAAANSIVCYCLGITSVDPTRFDLLFARFVSKERAEPPDIDIDFEHERREEVIQYIYAKYGREYAGLTCEVVTYRHRSAVREVGKALGLSLEIVDKLAKSIHRWTDCSLSTEDLKLLGLNPDDSTILNVLTLTKELLGFPRHLSQHVGGFIICQNPLCESVPILNARMPERTIIEWDKDDIEALGMLKIDVLGLGMLTCIRKGLELVNQERKRKGEIAVQLYTVPAEDKKTYDMICKADTLGVFQIESRAQMSMLPRLKPRSFYDLVIEVAIVRPGPIQGDMVHPYLKRRNGIEKPFYPDKRVQDILGRTLGVPLFQEQAMRLAIVLAGFSPGEAEQLRRAMAAWKRNEGVIAAFKERITKGMVDNGYTVAFAETCMTQLKGFAEYGFPESHAASFALLVYTSSWIKCHYPAEFACSLLNSQPMGFYAPPQIISDAITHGVSVEPIDINNSNWDCTLVNGKVRLGMRYVRGLHELEGRHLEIERRSGAFISINDIWERTRTETFRLRRATLEALARADAFTSLHLNQREALWEIKALPVEVTVMEKKLKRRVTPVALPTLSLQESMFEDYSATGLSLKAHPLSFMRENLSKSGVSTIRELREREDTGKKQYVSVAGLSLIRQRPGSAKGVVFIMIEDETGTANLTIWPDVFEQYRNITISSSCLLAYGVLEKIEDLVYVSVVKLQSLDEAVVVRNESSFPTKSYSY